MSTATAPLAWFVPNILRTAWAEATVIALAVIFGLVRIVTAVPRVSIRRPCQVDQMSDICKFISK